MALSSIPGLEVEELPGKRLASQSRAVGPSLKPNFTMPDGRPPLQLAGPPPNTALTIRNAPDWTVPPAGGARQAFDFELPPQAPPRPTFDAGPGNPNVGPNGSAQAQAFRAAAAPVAPAAPPSMRDRIVGELRQLSGGTARGLAGAALPTVAGAAIGGAQRVADLSQQPEPFVPAPARPGDIPSDPTQSGPPVIPERRPLGFGPNNEFTRNVANTMMALAPVGALPAATPRLPVFAAATGTPGRIRAGVDATARTAQQFVAGAQGGAALAGAQGGAALAGDQPFTPPPVTAGPLDMRHYPTGPTGPTSGVVMRDGNSFSGTDIKPGFTYGGDGRPTGLTPAQGGGGLKGGGTVTSLDTREGFRQDQMELGRLQAERAQREAGFAGNQPGGGLSGFRDTARDEWNTNFDRDTQMSRLESASRLGTGGERREAIRAMTELSKQPTPFDAQQNERARVAAQSRASDQAVRIAEMNNATQRRNNDQTTQTTMRGHELDFEASRISARLAAEKAAREQGNWQATHNAGRSDAAFTQGQQAIKDLHTQVAGWIPPVMQDGKAVPDTQTAARYATAMQSVVGRMGKTMKDMDETDKSRIIAGMQLADVASATATGGWTPWGTRAIQSNEPILALRKLDNGDYQTNRKGVNGETEIIPGRYVEKEGSSWGMGGMPTNRFAQLIEQGNKK